MVGPAPAAKGLAVLISPANWYFAMPGVTATGLFNQHFVRDIGLIFLLDAIAMVSSVCWLKPGYKRPDSALANIP